MKTNVQIPCVHLNGSSRKNLTDGLKDSYMAVQDAIQVLRNFAPHQRDYYPLGDNAWKKARAEHTDRLNRLQSVADELVEIAKKIQDFE